MTRSQAHGNRAHTNPASLGCAKVFLSYGRRDAQELAERLRDSLDGRFDVWQDKKRIRVAHNWDAEIEAGIQDSDVVVFLLTPHSVRESRTSKDGKSSVSRDELAYARDHDVPIIPVRVMPSDTPLLIHRLQQINFQQWAESESAYDAGVARIAEAIEMVVRGEPMAERTWYGLPTPYNFEPLIRAKLHHFTSRQWLFDEVKTWLDKGVGHALLVVGDPGAGKSAAAAAMVRDNVDGRVLAYHFCDYATPETTNPATFVRSLVALISARLDGYERMVADPEIGRVLARADDDPASAFENVVLGLLAKLPAPGDGARFILVDALDEALIVDRRPTIVDVLSSRLDRLPPWLKLVGTTRRDPPVMERLKGLRGFPVDAHDPRTRADIERYISERLRDPLIHQQIGRSSRDVAAAATRLLDASEGNFLAASTALEAVREGLITLAEAEGLSPKLEPRYQMFFERMFARPDSDFGDARRLLQVVVAAQEPLLRSELSAVLAFDDDEALTRVLRRLSSFVPGAGGRFKLVHKTLGDWLTGEIDGLPRAGQYTADPVRGHELLANWCWREYKQGAAKSPDYCLRHLPMHLAATGRTAALEGVLFDLEWMRAKLAHTDAITLRADYQLLKTEASRRVSVTVMAATAADERTAGVLAQQLLARLPADDMHELVSLRDRAAQAVSPPELRPRFPTMSLSGLLFALEKPPSDLATLTLSGDGRIIHGVSTDGKQSHWHASSGRVATGYPDVAAVELRRAAKPKAVKERPSLRKAARKGGRRRTAASLAVPEEPSASAASADGLKVVESWRDGMLSAFHAANRAEVRRTKGHHYGCKFVRFLDDDRFATYLEVYAGGRSQGEAKIWDFHSLGTLPAWPSHTDWVRAIAFFPDGKQVASVSIDNSLTVWDHATGELRQSTRVTWNSVGGVAVSPDADRILTGDRQHELQLWDRAGHRLRAWRPKRWVGQGEPADPNALQDCYCINGVAFTQNPEKAVIAADGLYEVDVGDAYRRMPPVEHDRSNTAVSDTVGVPVGLGIAFEGPYFELYSLAVAPDDSIVIAGGGSLRDDRRDDEFLHVYDLPARRMLFPLPGHERGVTGTAIAMGSDGLRVVSSSGDGTVISWDLKNRRPARVLRGHVGVVRGVALTADGRHAVSAGTDRTLRVWDLDTGKELSRFSGDAGFSACAIGPDGHLVAGDMAGHVHFFEPVVPS